MDQTLRGLTARYVGGQSYTSLCHFKPCKKPKWQEFEDSDDERIYKKKTLKYRAWRYSLVCAKNLSFDAPVKQRSDLNESPVKKRKVTDLAIDKEASADKDLDKTVEYEEETDLLQN